MSGVSMLAAKSVMARLAIASIGWAMLSAHLRALARELSNAVLMDRLAKASRELYFANTMQPIEMGEHIPGLWLAVNGALPNSRIVMLPGQQHIAMDTAPDLFVREVLAFLAKPA